MQTTLREGQHGTQRGKAATWYHTWALPTILAVSCLGNVGARRRVGSNNGSQKNSPLRENILGSLLLGDVRVQKLTLPTLKRGMGINRCHFFIKHLLTCYSLFFLQLAIRPKKIVFYLLDIFHGLQSETSNNYFLR